MANNISSNSNLPPIPLVAEDASTKEKEEALRYILTCGEEGRVYAIGNRTFTRESITGQNAAAISTIAALNDLLSRVISRSGELDFEALPLDPSHALGSKSGPEAIAKFASDLSKII